MDFAGRQQRLMAALERHKLAALLITHLPNIRYLTGFTGSAGFLTVEARPRRPLLTLYTDGRYREQAAAETRSCKVHVSSRPALTEAASRLQKALGRGNTGFEADRLTVVQRAAIGNAAGELRWRPVGGLVERLRMVKEAAEVEQIRQAVRLASDVFNAVVGDIAPGVLESSIAAEIEYMCRRLGAESMSFETIVASGPRSALPHGRATHQPIPEQGFVVLDFGVVLGGYCSDMTRTVHVGKISRAAERIYRAVQESQLAGIKAVKAGVPTWKVDYEARKVLQKYKLDRYFTHSTGHGVGIEIHEPPGLRKRSRNRRPSPDDCLKDGMVITVEPGVYIPGTGGVRIEDMVLVTESGCEVLTPVKKDLVVL